MSKPTPPSLSPHLAALLLAGLLALSLTPARADDDEVVPKGAAVTVLKAAKSCFDNNVEVSGTIIAREETQVLPPRPGLKVAEVLAEPGDTVTAGQVLAKLNLPEGGQVPVPSPVAGIVLTSTAAIGAMASAKGESLFTVIARGEFDLVGLVPTRDISKLAVNQMAQIKVIGAGEVEGKIRRLSTTVQPDSQLAQAFIGIAGNRRLLVNSSARAVIKTGQSCGVAVPLTAILYGTAGTVVQVVRRGRVETKQVETGLMSGGQVEIRSGIAEGDVIVARAGALLREGDLVRPVTASAAK